MAIVAVAVNTAPRTSTTGKTLFVVRATSADISGNELLKANAAAGVKIAVTKLRLSSAVACSAFLTDEDGNVLTQTYYFMATGGDSFIEVDFSNAPRYLVAAKALHIDGASGAISIEVEGFLA